MSGKSKSKAKSKDKAQSPKLEEPQAQSPETPISTSIEIAPVPREESIITPETTTPETEPIQEPAPTPIPTLTLEQLHQEIQTLKALTLDHTGLIAHLQEALARKRKPVSSNGKIQITDKQTGQAYPSKNNAYQSLLKSGELKDLVDKGLFGPVPEKNTFGWYVLVREWPDRFEEVHEIQNSA